jgi:AcrR family transcriptional regulator
MTPPQISRRRQRTREKLRTAFQELLKEKDYYAIPATEIAHRAGLNRNTFYLYFANRDDIFLSFHWKLIQSFAGGIFTKEELLAPEAPSRMIASFEFAVSSRRVYNLLARHPQANIIMNALQRVIAYNLRMSIRDYLGENEFSLEFDAIAGTQVAMLTWWLLDPWPEPHQKIVQVCHQLRRAALIEIFHLPERSSRAGDADTP